MKELNDETRDQIMSAIKARRKIEAIKIYREATGVGLKDSKEFIEELTDQLVKQDPDSFQPAGVGCSTAVLLFGLISVGAVWIFQTMI